MTGPAQASATAVLQEAWDALDETARAEKHREGEARRRAQRLRRIQDGLEVEARRLGLQLVITHRTQPGGTAR